MALPGHRRTSSHKRRRASHFALKRMTLSTCEKCGKKKLPHIACAVCGTYRGRQVMPAASVRKARIAKKRTTATTRAKKDAE